MLLEFTVGNFLSFKDNKTFSLEATSITENKNNVVNYGNFKILPSAVVYGANSSGKSNLIKAIEFMVETIRKSSKLNSTDELETKPFLLNNENEKAPSFFEILFVLEGNRFRYGFEIDSKKVHSEWLYILESKKKKEDLYFVRNLEGIGVADIFEDAKGLESKTRDNALFLSLADQFNSKIAGVVLWPIMHMVYVISGIEHKESIAAMNVLYKDDEDRLLLQDFIKKLGLGFKEFSVNDDDSKNFRDRVYTLHNKFNKNGKIESKIEFKMTENESSGTNKIFDLSGYVVIALKYGTVLIIDELDSKLHPILTQEIIKLFNNPNTNPKKAQLIFTTHDTNLLSSNLFRRDQIWFTEKDQLESTDLYSLIEFKDSDGKKIRKDRSFEKDYIKGRYGAIPFVSNFQEI
jgi:AAA15 family ATPase/GTPase